MDPLDGRGFTAIQRSRARTFLASNREEVRHRYRTGLSVQEVVESFLQDHPGLPVGSVKTTIAEQLLFTTRDKSIRWLMRRPASRPAHQQWSNSEILAAIRRVATDHCGGTAPTVTDYDEARELWRGSDGNPEIPSRQLITDRFRSWNRARVLAGFPVPITGHRSDKKWPAERVLSRVFALVRELDELPSVQRFDAIREAGLNQQSVEPLPAAVTVRKELSHDQLGKWDDLRAMIYQSLIDLGEWTV